MKTFLVAVVAIVFAGIQTRAAPSVQHLARGIVHSVNAELGVIVIAEQNKDESTEFVVEAKRTRLRCDGVPSSLNTLVAGQPVQIYFRREAGKNIATEVSWKSAAIPRSK